MWPFTAPPAPTPSTRKQLAELQDRIQVLEGRLDNATLDFEDRYEKLYDRLSRVYGRLTKRSEAELPAVEPPPPDPGPLMNFRGKPKDSTAHLAHRFKVGG